jgi:hypothetical protein
MTFIRHPFSVPFAIGTGLLTVWLAAGLGAALVAGALADLGLTVLQRRHPRHYAPDPQRQVP